MIPVTSTPKLNFMSVPNLLQLSNLKEVVELCLEEMDTEAKDNLPEFVGLQQVEVAG